MDFISLQEALQTIRPEEVVIVVISNPRLTSALYRKIRAERKGEKFQISSYTDTQVFHRSIPAGEIITFCEETAGSEYKQLNIWLSTQEQVSFLISRKGPVHANKRADQKSKQPRPEQTHNRQKNYIIQEGMIVPPLIDMGVLSEEGKIIPSKYDKFKQINRFLEIINDEFRSFQSDRALRVVDFGCGKAYLTFILYYYFSELRKIPVEMIGLDLKNDVIEKCNQAAGRYGYRDLRFQVGDIADYAPPEDVDMVVTLHACDTATDFALYNAVKWKAKKIFSVPCCQHEINQSIQARHLGLLTRYGIIRERFSALLTDALRADILECHGYETQVLEFIDMEHTPKNIMIRASKRALAPAVLERRRAKYKKEMEEALEEFQVKPTLYRLLMEEPV